MDKYQERYLQHRKMKKGQLFKIMKKRYSTRVFSDKDVKLSDLNRIIEMSKHVPSSCNRKAIGFEFIRNRDDKQLLSGLLVGGAVWLCFAPVIILLFANKEAYKENLEYMPYLDAGCIVEQIYLTCTELGLGCCYVNPNIRKQHRFIFEQIYGNEIFCGALAIGHNDG